MYQKPSKKTKRPQNQKSKQQQNGWTSLFYTGCSICNFQKVNGWIFQKQNISELMLEEPGSQLVIRNSLEYLQIRFECYFYKSWRKVGRKPLLLFAFDQIVGKWQIFSFLCTSILMVVLCLRQVLKGGIFRQLSFDDKIP